MSSVRFCFRADDIGSSQSANAAARQFADLGIARNISLMVPVPFFHEAADFLKTRDDLCIGLHVTLNCEWDNVAWPPSLGAAGAPSLVNDAGAMFPTTQQLNEKPMRLEEGIAEVANQLKLARAAGLDIKYMDEHMGVGWVAGLSGALDDLCRREDVICLKTLHFRRFAADSLAGPELAARIAQTKGDGDPTPYLIVLHPACDDVELQQYYHGDTKPGVVSRQRDLDRQVYCDRTLARAVKSGEITPLRFDQIA